MTEVTFTDKNVDRIRSIQHSNFLDYLSSAYEVLRKIFSYLSLDDLENVSKALERWRPIVETTKKERTVVESFVLSNRYQKCDMWGVAKFCITFCLEENESLEVNLKKHLAKDCQFVVVQSQAGVIGTPNDLSEIVQLKIIRYGATFPNAAFATHVRIPSFPNVGIKTFTWEKSISFKDFRESFSVPENQIIKCLIILITSQESNREACEQKDDFVLYLQSIQNEGFAVGGCLIDSFLEDSQSTEAVTKYIVFYGDKVEAASIVLDQDVRSKERIESKVEEFKMICPKTQQGVLFVYRCCSRNKIFKQNRSKKELSKWEGELLMKNFPKTPIVGCYGYGEFGRKFPDSESSKNLLKRSRQSDIWEYSFSTSIVFVGFNK